MKPTIYLIEHIGTGSLSIMAKPDSEEIIDDAFENISLQGINTIVSLLEIHESAKVGLHNEETLTINHGMAFKSFPIKDLGIPASKEQFKALSKSLYKAAQCGENIVIHCHAGIGRSGLVAAGALLLCGYDALDAFKHITEKRGEISPETEEQKNWLIENQMYILSK